MPRPNSSPSRIWPALKRRYSNIAASAADHRHALDLDQHARAGEVRHRDERTRRIVPVGKESLAHVDEAVAVARIVDEDRHSDEVDEAAAGALQGLVHEVEDHAHLRVEIAGNVIPGFIARRRLAGKPYSPTALGDHGRRKGARLLKLGLLHVFGHWRLPYQG